MLGSGFLDRSIGLNVFVAWQFLFGRDAGMVLLGQRMMDENPLRGKHGL